MKFPVIAFCGLLVASLSCQDSALAIEASPHGVNVSTDPVTIDRAYGSMEGPGGFKTFMLTNGKKPELLWVTGGKVELLDQKNRPAGSKALVCHANMRFDPHTTKSDFGQPIKIFSFVQGQPEIRLPAGFGIPVLSSKLLEFNFGTMNPEKPLQPFSVKAEASFQYLRDNELKKEVKPLVMKMFTMQVPIENSSGHPADCPMLKIEDNAAPAKQSLKIPIKNENGYEQTSHWMVPPGRHTYHYRLEQSDLTMLPNSTTIHYINAHLHPHAESIELRDMTTNQSLLKLKAQNSKDRSSLIKFDEFSSTTGLPISRDHKYEMICEYNNTTDHEIDAMALLFVYLLDRDFDKDKVLLSKGS